MIDSIGQAQIAHNRKRKAIEDQHKSFTRTPRYYGSGKVCPNCRTEYTVDAWSKRKTVTAKKVGGRTVDVVHCGCYK